MLSYNEGLIDEFLLKAAPTKMTISELLIKYMPYG